MFQIRLDIPKQNQVFVRRLPYYCTHKDVEECFSAVGKVVNVFLAFDNGRPKGYGFVAFSTPEEARAAAEMFNGYEMTIQISKTVKRSSQTRIHVAHSVSTFYYTFDYILYWDVRRVTFIKKCKHSFCSWSWELFITELLFFICSLVLLITWSLIILSSLGQRSRLHGSLVINYVNSFYWT